MSNAIPSGFTAKSITFNGQTHTFAEDKSGNLYEMGDYDHKVGQITGNGTFEATSTTYKKDFGKSATTTISGGRAGSTTTVNSGFARDGHSDYFYNAEEPSVKDAPTTTITDNGHTHTFYEQADGKGGYDLYDIDNPSVKAGNVKGNGEINFSEKEWDSGYGLTPDPSNKGVPQNGFASDSDDSSLFHATINLPTTPTTPTPTTPTPTTPTPTTPTPTTPTPTTPTPTTPTPTTPTTPTPTTPTPTTPTTPTPSASESFWSTVKTIEDMNPEFKSFFDNYFNEMAKSFGFGPNPNP